MLRLAIPLTLGMLFQVAFNLVDAYFIGGLGTDAFAAVNLASFSIWLLSAVVGVVGTGANARVAQVLGSKLPSLVSELRTQALRLSLLLGFITSAAGLAGVERLTQLMTGHSPETGLAALLASQYLSVIFLAAPLLCFNDTCAAIFRGASDTRTPTLVLSLGFLLNALLDPILIYGWGPIPKLGVVGAALASVLSFLFSSLLFAYQGRAWLAPGLPKNSRFSQVPNMLKIGFPPSVTNIVFCLVYMGVTPYIAGEGTEALAALGLGHKVISISYFLCLSFSLAAITLTGESTGAENISQARHRGWVTVVVSGCANGLVGLALMVFSSDICSLFVKDSAVVQMASSYLLIVVPSQVLLGIGMSIEGAFAGFGHTTAPMIISVLSSLARWPAVAWVATSTAWGTTGFWWMFAMSTHLRGLGLLALLFHDRKSSIRSQSVTKF